ncbi:MAG: allantoinase AllB [Clostridia bacterium]|nr:allantoinase AllB [Clostridia bacterium]
MHWQHVIKNGTVVTPSDSFKNNIYIHGGKIAAITSEDLPGEADEITNAEGKVVVPGFIDTHVHSRDGFNGAHYKEDFFHSSMAGACGGITTIYEMPNCNPAIYNTEKLYQLIECITPKAHIDFGVWGLCLGNANNSELPALAKAGVVGFKFFWGYAIDASTYQLIYNYKPGMENVIPPLDQSEVLKIFREAARTGKMVAIHAENFDLIRLFTDEILSGTDRSYQAFLKSRPPLAEITIIETAIAIAKHTGAHLHILHLAAGEAVDIIRRAQLQGVHVTAETCPHYLTLTDSDGAKLGSTMKGYPPVRTARDRELLWTGVRDGTISCICSDHAPHTIEEKNLPLFEAPAGMVAIETMVPLMLDAVYKNKISISTMVKVLSEQPAKLYGTYPNKGSLHIGTDADIVIIDPDASYVFDQNSLHSRTKLSPYHGMQMHGRVEKTILRGNTIALNGEIVGKPIGQFIKAK